MSVKMHSLNHQLHSGGCARSPYWDSESKISKFHIEKAFEEYRTIGKQLYPDLDWDQKLDTIKEDLSNFSYDDYKKVWEAQFGKLDDPETKKRIDRTLKELEERRKEPKGWQPPSARYFGTS